MHRSLHSPHQSQCLATRQYELQLGMLQSVSSRQSLLITIVEVPCVERTALNVRHERVRVCTCLHFFGNQTQIKSLRQDG